MHGQPPDDRGKGLEQVPKNQGFWNDSSLGLLNDFMARSYQGAGAPAGNGPDTIAEIAAAGGSAFLTSLVFGPEAGVADALLEGGKDAFQTATEQTLRSVWPDTVDSSPSGGEALAKLTGVQWQWALTVNQWYNGTGPNQPPPGIDPVHYMGRPQPYTGDPTAYERAVWRVFHQGRENRGSRHDRREPAGAGRLQCLAAGSGHRQRQ